MSICVMALVFVGINIAGASKQQISDLVEEKLQVLESESGHAMKRGKNSQGQPRVTRWIISLYHSVEDLISKNDDDDDDDRSVTLILGQDHLRIGYVALNNYHLHTPKKVQCQLQDSQNRIDTLHAQLFDLQDRLYDVEHACNIAEMHVELLQTSGLGARCHKNLCSLLPKRKTMMHEYYPDGGQSIRWVTDKEFGPYDDSSAEEVCGTVTFVTVNNQIKVTWRFGRGGISEIWPVWDNVWAKVWAKVWDMTAVNGTPSRV
ncbi:hypothetical protein BD769DRAFT_1391801 [Suillus cothurnatus]|nr:hypothetical protein BD769DRAFT_1391801 [Suillus cothurnatus]